MGGTPFLWCCPVVGLCWGVGGNGWDLETEENKPNQHQAEREEAKGGRIRGIGLQEEEEKGMRESGREEGGRKGEGGRRGGGKDRRREATSFIYYDASCSVGLMCGEQTVFYVLILQAVFVGWG